MAMVNMKLSPAEAKDETICCAPDEARGPAYPYGLCLYLDNETLTKLGITDMPPVGEKMKLYAIVEVTGNSQRQTQDGKTVNMDLQITDMELASEQPDMATRMYGGSAA